MDRKNQINDFENRRREFIYSRLNEHFNHIFQIIDLNFVDSSEKEFSKLELLSAMEAAFDVVRKSTVNSYFEFSRPE